MCGGKKAPSGANYGSETAAPLEPGVILCEMFEITKFPCKFTPIMPKRETKATHS